MGGGFTLHPTLLPQVQLGPLKVSQIVRWTFFVRSFFRFNFQLGFLMILMQHGSILGANLALCWRFFSLFLPPENCCYLEVVLGTIFLRFRIILEDRKPAFRIVNNRVWYTSAFST